jgi:hypothetical protein
MTCSVFMQAPELSPEARCEILKHDLEHANEEIARLKAEVRPTSCSGWPFLSYCMPHLAKQ